MTRTLGAYSVKETLFEGQMQSVYRCLDRDLERQVLAMVFNPACAAAEYPPEVWRLRFLMAARAHDAADHPNVARLLAFDRADDATPYMIFDFMPRTLADHLGSDKRSPEALGKLPANKHPRRLGIAEATALLAQILDGVTRLHELNLVHRDLKPANIRLLETDAALPTIKLVVACAARFPDLSLTGCGINFGSLDYMAPEQRRDTHDVDARADLYAVGVIAYRMLTGHLPDAVPRPPKELRHDLSPALSDWVMDAMAQRRHHRPRDARSMRSSLIEIGDATS